MLLVPIVFNHLPLQLPILLLLSQVHVSVRVVSTVCPPSVFDFLLVHHHHPFPFVAPNNAAPPRQSLLFYLIFAFLFSKVFSFSFSSRPRFLLFSLLLVSDLKKSNIYSSSLFCCVKTRPRSDDFCSLSLVFSQSMHYF